MEKSIKEKDNLVNNFYSCCKEDNCTQMDHDFCDQDLFLILGKKDEKILKAPIFNYTKKEWSKKIKNNSNLGLENVTEFFSGLFPDDKGVWFADLRKSSWVNESDIDIDEIFGAKKKLTKEENLNFLKSLDNFIQPSEEQFKKLNLFQRLERWSLRRRFNIPEIKNELNNELNSRRKVWDEIEKSISEKADQLQNNVLLNNNHIDNVNSQIEKEEINVLNQNYPEITEKLDVNQALPTISMGLRILKGRSENNNLINDNHSFGTIHEGIKNIIFDKEKHGEDLKLKRDEKNRQNRLKAEKEEKNNKFLWKKIINFSASIFSNKKNNKMKRILKDRTSEEILKIKNVTSGFKDFVNNNPKFKNSENKIAGEFVEKNLHDQKKSIILKGKSKRNNKAKVQNLIYR